jgi:hypothetical protein
VLILPEFSSSPPRDLFLPFFEAIFVMARLYEDERCNKHGALFRPFCVYYIGTRDDEWSEIFSE